MLHALSWCHYPHPRLTRLLEPSYDELDDGGNFLAAWQKMMVLEDARTCFFRMVAPIEGGGTHPPTMCPRFEFMLHRRRARNHVRVLQEEEREAQLLGSCGCVRQPNRPPQAGAQLGPEADGAGGVDPEKAGSGKGTPHGSATPTSGGASGTMQALASAGVPLLEVPSPSAGGQWSRIQSDSS